MTEDSGSTPLRCRIFGHRYPIDPPWTGKEYRMHDMTCQRCGHRPEIRITGSARPQLEHRGGERR